MTTPQQTPPVSPRPSPAPGGGAATPPIAHESSILESIVNETLDELSGPFHEAFEELDGLHGASDDELHYEDDDYEQLDIGDFLDIQDVGENVKLRLKKFVERQVMAPQQRLLRHKLTFTLSTLFSFMAAYWLGRSPQTFYRLYTVQAGVLFSLRWVAYRWQKWHYYLWDFCYFAQILLLLQLWVLPTNITLLKMCFAFNCGPLVWSILAFRNSLVYHSLDKMTSHFMHWFPAIVSWAARWYPPPVLQQHIDASPQEQQRWEHGGLWDLAVLPIFPYLAWAILYYIKIFVVSSKRIRERGYHTLFQYVTSRPTLFATVVLRFPQRMQPLVYMAMHVVFTMLAMSLNVLWWHSYLAHSAFLLAIFGASAYSGSIYYFEYFSRKYIAGLGLDAKPASKSAGVPGGSRSPSISSVLPGAAAAEKKHA